jgi:DNA excision repair protein ERCC-3
VGKSTIVLCPNQTSVAQWKEQFLRFTTISPKSVILLTAKEKTLLPPLNEAVLLLTTYPMIGSGGRAAQSAEIMRMIREREWGIMVLDEVHTAVAQTFRKALKLRAHCRLGLTATLVREDSKDKRLAIYIGPKLYEANWNDLTKAGYLANVQICEVWCPMTKEFYREYLLSTAATKKRALAVMNPIKCAAMDYLMRIHGARNDKIIVFSESVFALRMYADRYKTLAIEGNTPQHKRDAFILAFKTPDSGVNKLFLSKVGDVALDVPDANVIIQISSHFGSRLQEAQRMGRILRRGTTGAGVSGNNAWFYTLISTDTMDVYFSNKRRRYLVDQGYAYKVLMAENLIPATEPGDKRTGLERLMANATAFNTLDEQLNVLSKVSSFYITTYNIRVHMPHVCACVCRWRRTTLMQQKQQS